MLQKILSYTKILTITSLVATSPLLACNGSHVLGAGGSGAIYTMSANTLKKDSLYVGINAESLQNKSLSDSKMLEAMANGSEHLHNVDEVKTYSLSSSYGITDILTLNMQLPFISRKGIRAGELDGMVAQIHPHEDSNGIGDISAILQYKFYDKEQIKIALLAGLKAPTGKTNVYEGSEKLEADLQPGSGSWDLFAGIVFTKDFEAFSFHSDILYKYNNTGVDSSKLGNVFVYNTAISYNLIDHKQHDFILHKVDEENHSSYSLDISFELNGEWADKDEFAGAVANNTGHNIIFATTGLQLSTQSNYSMFLSISVPIYQDFNGVQNDVDYKASLGIGRSF